LRNLSKTTATQKEQRSLELPLKIILNSIYGKTGQRVRGRIGNLFNPVIFATITGITRAQLYEFVLKNDVERDVVSFATDSICLRKKLDIDSTKLGEFSFDNHAKDVFVLQNGINRFNEKWKQRGLGKLGSRDIEHFDTYQKDGKLYCKFKVKRSGRLRSSILQNTISDIGKIKTIEREVNLDADQKRFWLREIKSVSDHFFCESQPLSFNFFQKDLI
jgi:hypothetical protein